MKPAPAALATQLSGIVKRRGPVGSVPGLPMDTALLLADRAFHKFGLTDYVGCVTAEMLKRPVPHIFPTKEVRALTELYVKWAPVIFKRVFSELLAPVQTYNKVSRLGYPEFTNPDNKQEVIELRFRQLEQEGLDAYKPGVIIINIRLQPEAAKKKRHFLFVNDVGNVYDEETSKELRTVETGAGARTAARTRIIFNMPMPNLYKQVLDTAIHDVFLRHPAFHHDMFGGRILPLRHEVMCVDVKHFERHTADAVRHRAGLIGGFYAAINQLFGTLPFAVPSDSWKTWWLLKPNREAGWSDQFASGDSAVAPAQKEIITALYAEYFSVTRGLTPDQAVQFVFQGGDSDFTFLDYGDDQAWSAPKAKMMQLFKFMSNYLSVEEEKPGKFLGFVWETDPNELGGRPPGFRLPSSSYLLKTYLNERAPFTNFRKFPYHGWVEKRRVYRQLGVSTVASHIIPWEDNALAALGLPWSKVAAMAAIERRKTLTIPGQNDPNWILGKDWKMTAEEKLSTGEFFGFMPEKTAPMIKRLLGQEWKKLVTWLN